MEQALQDKWAIALELAHAGVGWDRVPVECSVLLAVHDEMESLRDEVDLLREGLKRLLTAYDLRNAGAL